MVAVMATFFKRIYVSMLQLPGLLCSVPLTLLEAIVNSHLCQRLPDTHRQVWLSFLWGHCSLLLGPGAHKFCCALQEPVSLEILSPFHES